MTESAATFRATDLRVGNDLVERALFFSPVLFAIAIRMMRERYVLNLPASERVGLILLLAVPALLGTVWLGREFLTSKPRPGSVTIDGDSVTVTFDGGAARIARRDVLGGWRGGSGEAVFVRLPRWRYLGARLTSHADGERLLDAIGIGPADRTLRVVVASRAAVAGELLGTAITVLGGAGLVTLLAILGPVSSPSVRVIGALVSVALMGLYAFFGRARVVELGADGIRWMGRFIPYASIEGRREDRNHDVELLLDDGTSVPLPTGARAYTLYLQVGALRWPGTAYEVIVRRLDDARELAGRVDSTEARLAALEPARGEGVTAWSARVASLRTDAGPMRSALDRTTLEDVLDDGDGPPLRRLGAALALLAVDAEVARARLDRAVATTLNPGLREAFAALRDDRFTDAHLDALADSAEASA